MSAAERAAAVADEMKQAARKYAAQYDAFGRNGGAGAPRWLAERRERGWALFTNRGFPTTHEEAWRFTDLKPLARSDFRLAHGPEGLELARPGLAPFLLGGAAAARAVFVNGIFVPALSDTTGLPPGIRVGGVRAMLAEAPDVLERHLGRYAEDAASPFGGLNTAFLGDGAVLHIPPEVIIERPLHVLFLTTAANGGRAVSHPRTLVVAERGSRATLVESYAALAEAEYWTNAVTEVVLGDGANVDLYRVQQESGRGHHTAATYTDQGRASRFKLVAFAFGGHLVRHDVRATLGGEGADCTLDGLTMARGSQHVDHHTTLVHAQPNCTSWEYLNGVYDDQSRGVFNGRIIVRPGAQKTDAKQTNNNLLLSDRARADSQPQLEIYADDVKCTHGATLGPIDDEHLFYLQSRGLDRAQARQLLTYGFGSEILRAVDLPALRAELDRVVRNRLGEGATRRS